MASKIKERKKVICQWCERPAYFDSWHYWDNLPHKEVFICVHCCTSVTMLFSESSRHEEECEVMEHFEI